MNLRFYIILTLILLPFLLKAELWVYPKPGESIKSSPFYRVNVSQEGKVHDSFIYYSEATFGNLNRSSSWTTFSFEGKIHVEIDVLFSDIDSCIIRPKSKNVKFEIQSNKIYFELDKPHKLTIEINGDKNKSLFIFADGPEQFVPDMNKKGVWIFEPGVHDIGMVDIPDSVKHIYIAGGAYLKGAFKNTNKASGFKLTGRGIISSGIFENSNMQENQPIVSSDKNPNNVELSGDGINVIVEGITFIGGMMNRLKVRQSYATVRNCKFFGWQPNTSGVTCGANGIIEDCFFRCNDDAIAVNRNNLVVNNCVLWQNENGAPFQISWNLQGDYSNFQIYNCDVIHCEHRKEENNRSIFNAVHGGKGNLSNYLFENIRIEDNVFRLFKLTIRTSPYDLDPEFGSISNVHFKNVILEGKCLMPNEIWGYNPQHKISNVTFENLQINGEKILSAEEGNFKININTTENVIFK